MQYPGGGGSPQGNTGADARQPAGGFGWNIQNQPGVNSSMPGNRTGNQEKGKSGFDSFTSGDYVPDDSSGGNGVNTGGFGPFGGQQREFDGLDNPGSSNDSFKNNPSPDGGTFGPPGGAPGFDRPQGGPAFGPAGGEPSFGPPAGDSFFGPGGNGYDSGPMMGDPGFGPPDDGSAFGPAEGNRRGHGRNNRGSNGGGFPKPALIALCVLGLLVILFGGAVILDHFDIVKVPFIHTLVHGEDKEKKEKDDPDKGEAGEEPSDKNEPSAENPPADNPPAEESLKEEPEEEPSKEESSKEKPSKEEPSKEDSSDKDPSEEKADGKKTAESGKLSVSVTDIAPPELDDYRQVGITGLDAAPGAEGTAPVNMIGGSDDVWRTEVSRISSEDGKKIRLTFPESRITAVEIKAGNWTSKEAYNEDSRPIKIYLTLEGRSYPLSLNDKQVSHYIIFSRPVTSTELLMRIDSCSNDTSGYFAVTDIAVYSE